MYCQFPKQKYSMKTPGDLDMCIVDFNSLSQSQYVLVDNNWVRNNNIFLKCSKNVFNKNVDI